MARIALGFLLIGLFASLTGCFRQAEETFDAATLESPTGDGSATLPPVNVDGFTPTSTIALLVTVAPSITLEASNTGLPSNVILPTDTPAQVFITPGSPLGTLIVVTPSPTFGTPASVTPGGLITPTDDPALVGNNACEYTVKSGDTLFRIALNNDSTVEAIKVANEMTGETIFPGDILIIPNCGAETEATPDTSDPSATDLPDGWQLYIVQSGDVLGAIAERFGVPQSAIIAENNLDNPNSLSVGQELVIPAPQ